MIMRLNYVTTHVRGREEVHLSRRYLNQFLVLLVIFIAQAAALTAGGQ